MANVKAMTAGHANELTCDIQGCNVTTKYTTRQGLQSHIKKKHEPRTGEAINSQALDMDLLSQDDDNAIAEAVEDQELYEALDNLAAGIKEKEYDQDITKEFLTKIERLKKIVKAKTNIQIATKTSFDNGLKKRSEVEASQLKSIYDHERNEKNLRDRSMSIMKDSKKKKNVIKALEKDKLELKKELTDVRVKNGILEKDYSVLKIENDKNKEYISRLEDDIAPEVIEGVEVVELVEDPANVHMNKESQQQVCNACEKTFKTSQDLDNHIEAKHSPAKCAFCEVEFSSQQQLQKHVDKCIEYGNTVVKCKKCQQSFTRFGIKRHSDKCHEKQPISLFSCSECGHRAKTAKEIKQHQANTHQQDVEVSKEVCKHWRNGHCFKGNQCQFSHVGYQKNKTTSTPSTTRDWTAPCKHGDSCSWLEKGTCQFFHRGVGVQKPAVGRKGQHGKKHHDGLKMCHFNEKCYNKSTCPFKHTFVGDFHTQRRQQRPPMRVQKNGRFNQ